MHIAKFNDNFQIKRPS